MPLQKIELTEDELTSRRDALVKLLDERDLLTQKKHDLGADLTKKIKKLGGEIVHITREIRERARYEDRQLELPRGKRAAE
jgi:hypothetical protein